MSEMVQIRKALATLPNPVAVLTVNDDGEYNGMIASWITQISFDPPKVLVAVHPSRYTHQMITSVGAFNLNLITDEQSDLVAKFKSRDDSKMSKFAGLTVVEGPGNQPYLPDSAAVLHCRLTETLDVGDHTLFIGEVYEATLGKGTPASTTSLGKSYSGAN